MDYTAVAVKFNLQDTKNVLKRKKMTEVFNNDLEIKLSKNL